MRFFCRYSRKSVGKGNFFTGHWKEKRWLMRPRAVLATGQSRFSGKEESGLIYFIITPFAALTAVAQHSRIALNWGRTVVSGEGMGSKDCILQCRSGFTSSSRALSSGGGRGWSLSCLPSSLWLSVLCFVAASKASVQNITNFLLAVCSSLMLEPPRQRSDRLGVVSLNAIPVSPWDR